MSLIVAALRDLFVPPRCAGCDAPGSWLCIACRDGCEPVQVRAGNLVVRAAGSHAGPLRDAIHRLKYRDERGIATELGGLVAERMAADLAVGAVLDAVVPAALHPARAVARGYDQARLLADAVAERTGLPVIPALRRVRPGTPQVRLDRAAREANLRGAFVPVTRHALRGLRVALIDDVTTTGATLRAAAAATRAAGARSVTGYVVAVDE
ncbi:MAG: ComF family protein [Chloroflexi bacterium]|nr:ComF family protein [Chloroflexota bacterium]